MKLTPEQIQAKLDSFNKAYKESGLTDGKISRSAAITAAAKAGAYKKSEQHKKTMLRSLQDPNVKTKKAYNKVQKYGTEAGALLTLENIEKAKQARIKKFGSSTGYMNSPEIKAKWIEKKKKAILQYSIEGVFIKEWPSGKDVMKELKIKSDSIGLCARGKQKTAGGFIWKYKNEQ